MKNVSKNTVAKVFTVFLGAAATVYKTIAGVEVTTNKDKDGNTTGITATGTITLNKIAELAGKSKNNTVIDTSGLIIKTFGK